MKLPKKVIQATKRKFALLLTPLWIIILPMVGLMLWLSSYEFTHGQEASGTILLASFLGSVLIGLTALVKIRTQPLSLTHDGIEIMQLKGARFIAWSEISHIEARSQSGTRFLRLYLNEWQNRLKSSERKERWILFLKNLWVPQGFVRISSMPLDVSHKELLTIVETYFENSKNQWWQLFDVNFRRISASRNRLNITQRPKSIYLLSWIRHRSWAAHLTKFGEMAFYPVGMFAIT